MRTMSSGLRVAWTAHLTSRSVRSPTVRGQAIELGVDLVGALGEAADQVLAYPMELAVALLHLLGSRPWSSQTVAMNTCPPRPVPTAPSAFAGFFFPPDVIVLAVRWYLRFGLSYRDVEELLAERGVAVDHVTIYRWIQRFTPLLAEAARPCRHGVGDRWQVDETYVKVAGQWRYVPGG
jgi:hypothetical protein